METLGKIERPQTDRFKAARKIYLVPLVYQPQDAPEELKTRLDDYWLQVESQLTALEEKLGGITKIYHESLVAGGEEGLQILEKLNPGGQKVVCTLGSRGAVLEPTEEMDLLAENIDWGNCMQVIMTPGVMQEVYAKYAKTMTKRYAGIAAKIDQTLAQGSSGVLFVRPDHTIQFPGGVEVFYVAPPALDEIERWLREISQDAAGKNSGSGSEE